MYLCIKFLNTYMFRFCQNLKNTSNIDTCYFCLIRARASSKSFLHFVFNDIAIISYIQDLT